MINSIANDLLNIKQSLLNKKLVIMDMINTELRKNDYLNDTWSSWNVFVGFNSFDDKTDNILIAIVDFSKPEAENGGSVSVYYDMDKNTVYDAYRPNVDAQTYNIVLSIFE